MTITREGLTGQWEIKSGSTNKVRQPLFYISGCTSPDSLCPCPASRKTALTPDNLIISKYDFRTVTINCSQSSWFRASYVCVFIPSIWKEDYSATVHGDADDYGRGCFFPLTQGSVCRFSIGGTCGDMRGAAQTGIAVTSCTYGCVSIEMPSDSPDNEWATGDYHVSASGGI